MKRILFTTLILLSISGGAWAQDQVSGFIHRFGSDVLMSFPSNATRLYRVNSIHDENNRILQRLEEGDFVMASGQIFTATGSVSLDSIDFVGLRRIIGMWNSVNTKGLVNFKSYTDVNMYSLLWQQAPAINPPANNTPGSVMTEPRRSFKYTVTPANGNDWVLFLSDEKETQMGYLSLGAQTARIQMVSSQTGDVSKVIELQKLAH